MAGGLLASPLLSCHDGYELRRVVQEGVPGQGTPGTTRPVLLVLGPWTESEVQSCPRTDVLGHVPDSRLGPGLDSCPISN